MMPKIKQAIKNALNEITNSLEKPIMFMSYKILEDFASYQKYLDIILKN